MTCWRSRQQKRQRLAQRTAATMTPKASASYLQIQMPKLRAMMMMMMRMRTMRMALQLLRLVLRALTTMALQREIRLTMQ